VQRAAFVTSELKTWPNQITQRSSAAAREDGFCLGLSQRTPEEINRHQARGIRPGTPRSCRHDAGGDASRSMRQR
jgi:hypothetical protein